MPRTAVGASHTRALVEHGEMEYRVHNTEISPEWKCCSFHLLLALGLEDAKTWLCFQMNFDVYLFHFLLCWEQIEYTYILSLDFGVVTISFLLFV